VTVNATNTCGAGTTSNLAVTVYVIPDAPVITLDGAILSSSSATGNQWYHDGTPIPGANGQTYDATLSGSGWYWTVVTVNGCASDTSNNIYVLITGMTEHQTGNFKLYPVPNDGRFTFSMTSKSAQSVRLMVFNNVGVLVYEVNSIEVNGAIEKTIDMRPVASGFYTVVIETAEGRTIRKIVVNR
jgi:hypothetical protein